jgi:HEPN domain-containing protein/predicted nucleotidyltransferase
MNPSPNNTMSKDIFTEIKMTFEKASLPFDVSGVVAFGSRVKGKATPHSDFDLLIVASGINPKRHRRTNEIIQIKHCLSPLPLDILLLTPEEVISNFKNHNPLFLDIAEEGIVILDKNNFLKSLINEVTEYIKIKGIKRLGDGWKFPVKHGVATYLSNVSNKDFAMAMLKDGERDYLIGKKLLDEGFYDKSVYHFQQSVEKCIKSILIAFGIFQKTHFVGEILIETLKEQNIPESWKKNLHRISEISEGIEPEVSLSRYPGIIDNNLWLPFEEYEKTDAEKARINADDVLSVTKDFLKYWFQ